MAPQNSSMFTDFQKTNYMHFLINKCPKHWLHFTFVVQCNKLFHAHIFIAATNKVVSYDVASFFLNYLDLYGDQQYIRNIVKFYAKKFFSGIIWNYYYVQGSKHTISRILLLFPRNKVLNILDDKTLTFSFFPKVYFQ